MKRYAFVTFITGLLVFTVSHLLGEISIKGILFKFNDLLVNISATLISISFLAMIYYFAGEEPTTTLLKSLIEMQGAAKVLHTVGIIEFSPTRDSFDISDMHSRLARGNSAFIASRNCAFDYTRVRESFRRMVGDEKKSLKILIRSDSTRKKEFKDFIDELPLDHQRRIEVRENDRL
ncbi:MAG: hypothetical protein IPJ07_15845, partial [Acidobacteria bacterium]|nr:hypothetical protein [Acidobacteriota bacterium]